MNTKRNGAIDFLRFFFCILIVLRHSVHALPEDTTLVMPGGAMGVEFFFVVSGYLLACSAYKRVNNGNPINTAEDTNIFMKNKLRSFSTELVVASVFSMIIYPLTLIPQGPYEILVDFAKKIWNPLLLSAAGFGVTNEIWYLSAMIIIMLAFYPLLIKFFNSFVRIVAPLIAIFVLGYLSNAFTSLLDPSYFTGLLYKGMIRAIGEIALGVAIFPLIQALSKPSLTKRAKTLVTVGAFLSIIFAYLIIQFRSDKKLDFLCLLFITTGVILTFSHQGILADKFDNKVSFWLGKISLPLYLSHRWLALSINNVYLYLCKINFYRFGESEKFDYFFILAVYLVGSVCSCTVIYLISKYIRNHREELSAKFRRKYIAQSAD